jgi:predicted MFS family arabinose efflux permease
MIKPRLAALVLGLGTLVSHGFGLSLVPAMLPRIEETFDSGYGVLGLVIAGGLVSYLVGASLSARVLERLPTRSVLLGSLVLTGVGLLIVGAAPSPAFISVSVVILGFSAPISWTATTHVARESVDSGSFGLVMGSASGGAAVGVIVNGVLVQTSAELDSWRWSFVVAAGIAVLVVVATVLLFSRPITRPTTPITDVGIGAFRTVLRSPGGRIVTITSGAAGVSAFTFVTFLTATAVDEMGTAVVGAAALLWITGVVGVAAAPLFGRLGDRASPTFAIAVVVTAYGASLVLLSFMWTYQGLVIAAIGLGILNSPVWGLMAAVANRSFEPGMAVRAVSLGLIAASGLGAIGNAVTGVWIDQTGSLRVPIIVLAVIMSGLAIWLGKAYRTG